MKICRTPAELRAALEEARRARRSVGLVPTMGYLHEGHASLIERARAENDFVVASIFVNPIQFGPSEDLAAYPRDFDRDAALCERLGVDVVFHPEPEAMYAHPCVFVDVEELGDHLCGARRPGHFRGVCTVVTKLFNLVGPTRAYFGEKDAQQLAIIRKMVEDLNVPVEIVGCPIVREADGLAKSSRNAYLSAEERIAARCLSRAVAAGRAAVRPGMRSEALEQLMLDVIRAEPMARVDYLTVVDRDGMQPVEAVDGPVLVAMAVYIGRTRLIDNFTYAP